MENLSTPIQLILSFALGAAIGLEREINHRKGPNPKRSVTAIIGLRSFSLFGLFGCLIGILYQVASPIALMIGGAFLLLFLIYYYIDSTLTKDYGLTTEMAGIFSFLQGILIALQVLPIQLIIALNVALMLLLSQKDTIKNAIGGIERSEINAFISYAIIALVILPFLPNTTYALSDLRGLENFFSNIGLKDARILNLELFNPFKIWLVVALITGIDIVGYLLERFIGQKRGWLLASAAGGFISSTATTGSLALQSKTTRSSSHLVAAAIIANMVSFFQIALIIGAINSLFLIKLLPTLLGMIVAAIIVIFYFLRKKEKDVTSVTRAKTKSIFAITPALKFAGLFLAITIISKLLLTYFGSGGFLVGTALGAIAGLDAVMINTAELTGKAVDVQLGIIAFIIANAVNLITKTAYSFAN